MKRIAYTILITAIIIMGENNVFGRPFRVDQIPNGTKFSCMTCHTSAMGGNRNLFGQTVGKSFLGTQGQVLWGEALAKLDSDNDGFTNGEELQDPNGTWTTGQPNPGNSELVSNPGDPNSKPNTSGIEETIALMNSNEKLSVQQNFQSVDISISFELENENDIRIAAFNINGELVKNIMIDYFQSGKYNIIWNGTDKSGNSLPSGSYIIMMASKDFIATKKVIITN